MKILVVAPYLPYPVITGGYARLFNLMQRLSKKHQLYFVAYERTGIPGIQKTVLENIFKEMKVVERPAVWRFSNILKYLVSLQPYQVILNNRPQLIKVFRDGLQEWQPDLVHIEHFHIACGIIRECRRFGVPVLISEQGVEFVIPQRIARVLKNPLQKWAMWQEAWRIRRKEIAILNQADICLEASEDDSRLIRSAGVKTPTAVVPNGVDSDYFQPQEEINAVPTLIFIGSFGFLGNIDAVLWFSSQIWPKIKNAIPDCRWLILGYRPPGRIRRLATQDIEVKGWVPDTREYLKQSQVVVVPLRTGSGTKLKILEALSMAKVVVTTSIGLEGIECESGQGLLVADKPQEFASAVIELLKDKEKRKALGQRGRLFIQNYHRWDIIAERLERIYDKIVTSRQNKDIL